jgi:hypothetical protein
MTLNAFNPLFQVLAALVIFVTGFFALFISLVAAVALARLAYVGAAWASKGVVTLTTHRGPELALQPSPVHATTTLPWRDRLAEVLATPRLR